MRMMAMALGVILLTTTALIASPMQDVPTSHWAYNDIMEMQKRGLLLASSQGEFFPNNYVTFFEFSQILAKATGYEDEAVNPDMDPVLKESIRKNYEKQKPVIAAYEKNYKHWQKDANEEIAYLLGRGYLNKEDLGKFMSKSTSGLESKRGVRKQEATAYLVRTLHKAETAKNEYQSTGFIDQDQMDAAYRPYIAYMKKLGIVNGDEKGEFGPTVPITRATLSKMLIDTLKLSEKEPEEPVGPSDKALEGKLTKMINKGDGGYYLVLEVEPGNTQTYSIESTASVTDNSGNTVTLENLKKAIDEKGSKDVIATVRVQVVGVTEYIASANIISMPNVTVPEPKPEPEPRPEETFTGDVTGTIYSLLIGPNSEMTIEVSSRQNKKFDITFDTQMYHELKRKQVYLWDLRLNQEVNLEIVNNEIKSLNITKDAPPVTITGSIMDTSISGDQIEVRLSRGLTRSIKVPMGTTILDGTNERGRKDLAKGMEIVILYDEDEEFIPTKIIILSK